MYSLKILYDDSVCVVAEKPQGIPAEDASGTCVPSLLREAFLEKGNPAEIYPVHRLDKPTGGAILYAKTKESAAILSAAIANREFEKRYLTVVSGEPSEVSGRLCDLLYHDKRQNKVFAVKSARKGAKEAILDYRVLETAEYEGELLSLIEIVLVTGRTHQIRAQFASRRMPVYGDRRYGSKAGLSGGRIALWSYALTFPLGKSEERKQVISVPPKEFPFTVFTSLSFG